jgi:hypothetical protein
MKYLTASNWWSLTFLWIVLNLHSGQNTIEILISGKQTFVFLIFVGSNPQVQLEKCIFWPQNRSAMATSRRSEKAVYPSPFTWRGRMVGDGRLNCQKQFFAPLSEILSLLEYEWARPGNSDFFRWTCLSKCPPSLKRFTNSNSKYCDSHFSLGIWPIC